MDIIKSQADERRDRVAFISATITKAFGIPVKLNKEKIIAEISLRFSCSRRTALEYLQAALAGFNFYEEKIDGKIMIIEDFPPAPN